MIHDFNNKEYRGTFEAVKKFCNENDIEYLCLPDVCGSAVIVK